MDQILRGTPATLTATLTENGVPVDPSPDSATVTITHANGTVLVDGGVATDEGDGKFSRTLSVAQDAALGIVTAAWTFTIDDQVTTLETETEIVSAFWFTLGEFYAQYPELTPEKYPPALVAATRALAEQTLEEACGVAFVPRDEIITVDGTGTCFLPLWRARASAVSAATVDGDALDLAGVKVADGRAYLPGGWPTGVQNVMLTVTHGYDRPPRRGKKAAMILTRVWLVEGPVTKRATQQISVETGGVINLATPGMFGSHVGIPEVDAFIEAYTWPAKQIGSVSIADPATPPPSGIRAGLWEWRW